MEGLDKGGQGPISGCCAIEEEEEEEEDDDNDNDDDDEKWSEVTGKSLSYFTLRMNVI
jgi:hypothetical protein